MSDDFDPSEWDYMPDNAGFRHWRTGHVMAYDEAYQLEKRCDPALLEKAREIRDAAQWKACAEVTAKHLYAIGTAAGFEDDGKAFPWQSLVDHVLAKLEAAK